MKFKDELLQVQKPAPPIQPSQTPVYTQYTEPAPEFAPVEDHVDAFAERIFESHKERMLEMAKEGKKAYAIFLRAKDYSSMHDESLMYKFRNEGFGTEFYTDPNSGNLYLLISWG